MSEPARTTEELTSAHGPEELMPLILEGLGREVIVRDEEDGVGRFAGVRPVALVRRDQLGAAFLHGPYSELKKRVEDPMLTLSIEPGDGGSKVRLEYRPPSEPSAAAKLGEFVGDVVTAALTIAVLAYAVNRFRGLDVDTTRLALIAGGGALAYGVLKRFLGGEEEQAPPGTPWLLARIRKAVAGPDTRATHPDVDAPASDAN